MWLPASAGSSLPVSPARVRQSMTKRAGSDSRPALRDVSPYPSADNWPQWRGPSLNGLSIEKNLPIRWSKTENITWKLPLPAWSGSTPIVWGDRIFLNVAESNAISICGASIATRGVAVWKQRLGGGDVADDEAEHVVALAGHRRPGTCG